MNLLIRNLEKVQVLFRLFLYNPIKFSFHILRNFILILVFVPYVLMPVVLIARIFSLPLLFFLLIFPFFYRYTLYKDKSGQKMNFKGKLLSLPYGSPAFLFSSGIFLSALISFLVIHPRWGYLILPLGLGLSLYGRAMPAFPKPLPVPKIVSLVLLLLTLYFIPYRFTEQVGFLPVNGNSAAKDKKIVSVCTVRKKLQAIKNIAWKGTPNIAFDGDPTIYLNTKKKGL